MKFGFDLASLLAGCQHDLLGEPTHGLGGLPKPSTLHAEALGYLRPLSRRRQDLPDEQCSRTIAAHFGLGRKSCLTACTTQNPTPTAPWPRSHSLRSESGAKALSGWESRIILGGYGSQPAEYHFRHPFRTFEQPAVDRQTCLRPAASRFLTANQHARDQGEGRCSRAFGRCFGAALVRIPRATSDIPKYAAYATFIEM